MASTRRVGLPASSNRSVEGAGQAIAVGKLLRNGRAVAVAADGEHVCHDYR